MPRRSRQQPGVVMLLALLLLAAVTASTIGTAVTISNTTSQSANLDNFILASLAGDSGIERSLAMIKHFRKNGTIIEAVDTVNTANNAAPVDVSATNPNRGQFQGTVRTTADPVVIPILRPNETSLFDLFEYDYDPVTGTGTGALISSSSRFLFLRGVTTAGAVEVSWVLLDANGDSTCTGRYFANSSAITSGVAPSLLGNTLTDYTLNQQGDICTETAPKGFRVRVRALDVSGASTVAQETISNLTIESCASNSVINGICAAPQGIPGQMQINITGQLGASKAVKSATVLWQLPASGLFNYIIFSEGDIIPN